MMRTNSQGISHRDYSQYLGLYIHIPFCIRKCKYCDFLSMEIPEHKMHQQYVEALIGEIAYYGSVYGREYIVDTVFIGGGTPSMIDEALIADVMSALRACFVMDDECEITIESNPGTLNKAKLTTYIDAGINRLSIGVQSLDNEILNNLGRIHTAEEFLSNYTMARECGFNNINIDLMFALPGQTEDIWQKTLEQAISLKPEHISFYSLQLEEGTGFYEMYRQGQLELASDDVDRSMYHYACDLLKEIGYEHYEISNCAMPGEACKHNIKYWQMKPYLGMGLGSHSLLDGCRFSNCRDINQYIRNMESAGIEAGVRSQKCEGGYHIIDASRYSVCCSEEDCMRASAAVSDFHRNSKEDNMSEFIFTGLRMAQGIDLSDFEKLFGMPIEKAYAEEWKYIQPYVDRGFLIIENDRMRISREGVDISNSIMSEFV